jgi:hypothetical protein
MLCVSSDGKQCHYYQQKSICGCAKPVPKCPTLYVLVFIVVSDVEVRGDCLFCWYWWNCWPSWLKPSFHNNMSHRIVEYEKDYWISIFMFCKSQHGKIEGIWYLQLSKAAWNDVIWLEDNTLQNIKYVLNTMTIRGPINIRKVGRQHLCIQNRHTEGQNPKKEREQKAHNDPL